jgi:hypothetical protein
LKSRVGVAAVEVVEDAGDATEELAGALKSDEGVGERRGRGVVRDGGDLGEILGHAEFVGGREVFVADLVERRIAERERTGREERVSDGHERGVGKENKKGGVR